MRKKEAKGGKKEEKRGEGRREARNKVDGRLRKERKGKGKGIKGTCRYIDEEKKREEGKKETKDDPYPYATDITTFQAQHHPIRFKIWTGHVHQERAKK